MSSLNAAFLIAGTGTNVGKTWVTALLAQHYIASNHRAAVIKYVQTGPDNDSQQIQAWVPNATVATLLHFPDPVSPHLAAELANSRIDIQALAEPIKALRSTHSITLIECSGGLFTPISRDKTFCDLALQSALPIILVATNTVGTLHNCISTIRAAQAQNLELVCLFLVDGPSDSSLQVLSDNEAYLAQYLARPVFRIPYFSSFVEAQDYASDCGLFAHSPFIIQKLL